MPLINAASKIIGNVLPANEVEMTDFEVSGLLGPGKEDSGYGCLEKLHEVNNEKIRDIEFLVIITAINSLG